MSRNEKMVSERQANGRLVPVYPSLLTGDKSRQEREEAYIARMIWRDRGKS